VSAVQPVVHLVDDDPSFVKALARLLRASGYAVATHGSAAEFLAARRCCEPGCALLDLRMPGMDGLALQRALVESGDTLPIVFMSGGADVPSAVRAMHGGADDFLTKRADLGEIVRAIERALRHDQDARSTRERRCAIEARLDALTPREREVLRHVARGQPNKVIASALGIHERTVKLHRTSITAKLGVRSAAELAHLAAEAGLVERPPPQPAAAPAMSP
jgi:FixJ family two-component response regulator